jgi:hypothetical protein
MGRNIDRERFIALLNEQFPEVAAKIDDISAGLLHLEMATFSRETQAAIDARDNETVKRHFRFINEVFRDAAPDVENAVNVSYLENLRFDGRKAVDPGSGIAPAAASSGVGRPGGILGQAPTRGRPHLTSGQAGGGSYGAFHLHKVADSTDMRKTIHYSH